MKHEKGVSQKTNRALDARQKYLLCKWLDENISTLKGKNREDIVKEAEKELKFDVSVSSVNTALKATGLLLRGVPKQEKYRKNMAALLDQIKKLCDAFDVSFDDTLKTWRGSL